MFLFPFLLFLFKKFPSFNNFICFHFLQIFFQIFFLLWKPSHFITYFFSWKMCEIEVSSSLQYYSSTSSYLSLFIYSYSVPCHGVHIINHTSSHQRLFVVPIFTPLSTLLTTKIQDVALTNKLCTHYLPLQSPWNVHHATKYILLTCSQCSFLETLTFRCARIL